MCEGSKPRFKIGCKGHRILSLDIPSLAPCGCSAGLAIKRTLTQAESKAMEEKFALEFEA